MVNTTQTEIDSERWSPTQRHTSDIAAWTETSSPLKKYTKRGCGPNTWTQLYGFNPN